MLTSAKNNSTEKTLFTYFWKLDINGVKFRALLVQILTWEFFPPRKSNVHKKSMKVRVKHNLVLSYLSAVEKRH